MAKTNRAESDGGSGRKSPELHEDMFEESGGEILGALLCALALEPESFSRNRHFEAFQEPSKRATHRRARWLRALSQDLCEVLAEGWNVELFFDEQWTLVTYEGESLAVRRTVHLSSLEMGLLRWLLRDRCPEAVDERFVLTRSDIDQVLEQLRVAVDEARKIHDLRGVLLLSQRLETAEKVRGES